jgi:CheY-like chemotaxis protein
MAYWLRPPALDELGLVPAIREHAVQHIEPSGLLVSMMLSCPVRLCQRQSKWRVHLDSRTDVAIIGEVSDGDEAVAEAERLDPDVILMDMRMPGTSGIDATRRILARSPGTGILVLTMYDDDESVFAAMRADARQRPSRS